MEGSCCLSVRQAHWPPTWMVLGETLPQSHCQRLPLTTGTRGEHIMWCRELDAHWLHRTATLMIWATFLTIPWKCRHKPALPCLITQYAKKNCHSRCHSLWTRITWFTAGIFWGIGKQSEWGKKEGGERISGFVFSHQEEISLWPNCVRIFVKVKSNTSVWNKPKWDEHTQNESYYFRGAQAPSSFGVPSTCSETKV